MFRLQQRLEPSQTVLCCKSAVHHKFILVKLDPVVRLQKLMEKMESEGRNNLSVSGISGPNAKNTPFAA